MLGPVRESDPEGTGFDSRLGRELFVRVFWGYFGRFWDMFGTLFGHVSDILRALFGHVLDMFGNVLGQF